MRKLITGLIVVTLIVAGLYYQPSVRAATITVNTTADELNNDGDCSLREAIQAANTNAAVDACTAGDTSLDTINIPAGTYTLSIGGTDENNNATGDLDILTSGGNMDIVGAGAATTIIESCNGTGCTGIDRVLDIALGVGTITVNISGVTIRNGNTNSDGGGIRNYGTTNFTNSIISGNKALGNGGGIYNKTSSSPLTITNSTVSGNTTSLAGGGIYNNPGSSALTITNSTVSGNTTSGNNGGGGIYNTGSSSTLTITNSTLSDNHAPSGSGGGINVYAGTAIITNSTVLGNTAASNASGGGICNYGTLTINNSTLSGNRGHYGGAIRNFGSGTLTITNSTFSGNQATSNGGGIYNDSATATMTYSTFSGNTAPGTNGGGIYALSGSSFQIQSTIIANSTGQDCSGAGVIASWGYNLSDDNTCSFTDPTDLPSTNPLLASLANNGGPTQTHALFPGSPAIDRIPQGIVSCGPPTIDQRNVARPQGVGCEIGAFEYIPGAPSKKITTLPSLLPLASTNIAKANSLLTQADSLLSDAKTKNLDTTTCEKLIDEANELLREAKLRKASPITANYYALKAAEKLTQAIECLKALLG
jgi:CSLREA domain-containing protein